MAKHSRLPRKPGKVVPEATRSADESMPSSQADGANTKQTLVLTKVFRLLDAFTGVAPELTISELRSITGYPATTCARLVRNLVDERILDRVEDRYRIGLGVLRWSAAALRNLDVVPRLTPIMEQLRDETGESAGVYVRRGAARTCVAYAPTRHAVIWQLHVGMVTPIHVGSGSRAILAFDEEAQEEVLSGELAAFTDETMADPDSLEDALDQTRTTGLAISRNELAEDVAGISAPVFSASGGVVASIGIAGPGSRFKETDINRHKGAVLAAGRRGSEAFSGNFPFGQIDDPEQR